MLYELTATVNGKDNTLITSTRFFNHALKAKDWAIKQGFTNIHLHKFIDL